MALVTKHMEGEANRRKGKKAERTAAETGERLEGSTPNSLYNHGSHEGHRGATTLEHAAPTDGAGHKVDPGRLHLDVKSVAVGHQQPWGERRGSTYRPVWPSPRSANSQEGACTSPKVRQGLIQPGGFPDPRSLPVPNLGTTLCNAPHSQR
jgi:hypothetical protein